jgi:isochorismate synthase
MNKLIEANSNLLLKVSAHKLLGNYSRDSSFFFTTKRRTILTEGVYSVVSTSKGDNALTDLPDRVSETLCKARESGHSNPVVVGAITFDNTEPARLIVPQVLFSAGQLSFYESDSIKPSLKLACEISSIPEPEIFIDLVKQALVRIEAGEMSKVVLSRMLELNVLSTINIQQILLNLAQHNPYGYTFAVDIPKAPLESQQFGSILTPQSSRRTLLGASPELLVSRSGSRVLANPLAGSVARSKDPHEDKQQSQTLLQSIKDRHEHSFVVNAVSEALRPFCRTIYVPPEPSLLQTSTMWHLSTKIVGELADPSISSLTLAAALHPTPAVCGFPMHQSRNMIREIEPFDRNFYTGMVGWCNATGDGEWAITIRCAEVYDTFLRLFAGAGIVLGSNPKKELEETSSKFCTILNSMGIEKPLDIDP